MNDLKEMVQTFEDSNILLKGVTKTIKNETQGRKRGFINVLFGTLGASLLRNMLVGKGMLRAGYGKKEGKGMLRAGYGSSI